LETDTAILAKDPFDAPSPPGLPEITDWDEKSVKLKWEEPIRVKTKLQLKQINCGE